MRLPVWQWFERWQERRRRVRKDARQLVKEGERTAYYRAQRLATIARTRGNASEFIHWAKTAAEIARISNAEMNFEELKRIVAAAEFETRQGRDPPKSGEV